MSLWTLKFAVHSSQSRCTASVATWLEELHGLKAGSKQIPSSLAASAQWSSQQWKHALICRQPWVWLPKQTLPLVSLDYWSGVKSGWDQHSDQEFRTNCLRCILELAGHHRRLGRNIPASYERELMAWSGCNSVARSHTVFNVFLEEPVITPVLQLPLATSKPREIYKTFSFCCSGSSN